jgi:hypothetical protein
LVDKPHGVGGPQHHIERDGLMRVATETPHFKIQVAGALRYVVNLGGRSSPLNQPINSPVVRGSGRSHSSHRNERGTLPPGTNLTRISKPHFGHLMALSVWPIAETMELRKRAVHAKDQLSGGKILLFQRPISEVTMADTLDVIIRIQAEIIEARRLAAQTPHPDLAKVLLSVADEIEQCAREVDRNEWPVSG